MPAIQSSVSVAANGSNDNVLQGSQFEYLPYHAAVNFGLAASAVGLVADVYSGQDLVAESFTLPAVNRVPIMPDDFTLKDIAAAGDRLKIRLRNTTGGAITAFWSVLISPLGR
jgi:hypothetical protein